MPFAQMENTVEGKRAGEGRRPLDIQVVLQRGGQLCTLSCGETAGLGMYIRV